MKLSLSIKAVVLGLLFSLLAGCQIAPRGVDPGTAGSIEGARFLSDR